MFDWKDLGATWPTEQTYRILEILKENRIRCRMPADDMFFISPFHLPHPDRRWAIQVRRRDARRAMALLAREGLARTLGAADRVGASDLHEAARTDPRVPGPAMSATRPAIIP